MRFLSLFSGIGGFDLGLERAGMTCIGQVELDPYCRRQLERHWPSGVTRFRDVRNIGLGRAERHFEGEPDDTKSRVAVATWGAGDIDLVCGGFPCQDVSVAGKRAGLDGSRSGLWFEFQRILAELRPRWALIENVPGLLSSNHGRDFGVILDGLGECGFGGISWAVLDSQHFGVPQRRRRVFIVAGPSSWATEQVLSLCESCGGHSAPSATKGQDVAASIGGGSGARGWRDDLDHSTYIDDIGHALTARASMDRPESGAVSLIAVRTAQTSANGHGIAEDVAPTIDGANGQAIAHTLSADGFDASEDGTGRGTPLVSQTFRAGAGAAKHEADWNNLPVTGASVRRLTPIECARLQGFPDDWLDGADGPQYRALGNAVTVPVIEWISRRIMEIA